MQDNKNREATKETRSADVAQSSQRRPTRQEGRPTGEPSQNHTRPNLLNILMVVFTGLLAGGSLVFYFYYVPKQWDAMKESVTIAKQTLQVSERAWLGPGQFTLTSDLTRGTQFAVRVSLRNTGRTPALNVSVRKQAVFSPIPLPEIPEDFIFGKFEGFLSKTTVFQGTNVGGYASIPLSKDEVKQVLEGTAWVFIFVRAEYEDVFATTHKTHICQVYQPLAQGRERLAYCDMYNYAD